MNESFATSSKAAHKDDNGRCGFVMMLSILSFLVFYFDQMALAAEPEFYAQCHKLLPMADDFARECEERARPFSRTFHPSGGGRGEVESFSTYFRALDAPSHFVLGCVLDFKHKINFAGLYYSVRPLDMSHFDDYKIVFVDFGDNVGLEVDGAQITFVAVRQFVTEVIPPRLMGRPKNCEDAGLETIDSIMATSHDDYHLRKIDDSRIEYCLVDYCKIQSYATFFGPHEVPAISVMNGLMFIDANGTLMIEEKYYHDACSTWTGNSAGLYNIIFEACRKVH